MSPLPAKRRSIILDEVEINKYVSIAELEKRLNVTRETIRGDISELAKHKLVLQVRGGVACIEKHEAAMSERENINFDGKVKIAALVSSIIPDNASVIIDSGSTTQIAARALAKKSGLIIYTNDLLVATSLIASARQVHVLGGKLGQSELSTHGLDTLEMLSNYRADYSLIGVGGISSEHGFTDYDRVATKMRDEMISLASNAILLAGHEKFNKTAPVKLMNAVHAQYLLTDKTPEAHLSKFLTGLDLEVIDFKSQD